MYTVENGVDTMELLDYLDIAPAGTAITSKKDEDGNTTTYFKQSCGRWIDEDGDIYGSIEVVLELELAGFEPFNLNQYQLYIGNNLAAGRWYQINTNGADGVNVIERQLIEFLLNEVGITADDTDMTIHVHLEPNVPIKYAILVQEVFEEVGIDYEIVVDN